MKKLCDILFCLALLGPVTVSAVPTIDQASLNVYNADLQTLFTKVSPDLKKKIRNSIVTSLNGKMLVDENALEIKINSVGRVDILGLNYAPGLDARRDEGINFRVPYAGSWGIRASNVQIKSTPYKCALLPNFKCKWVQLEPSFSTYVTIAITDIRIQAGMRITGADNGKIDVDRPTPINASFKVAITGPTVLGLGNALEKLVNVEVSTSLDDVVNPLGSLHRIIYPIPRGALGGLANHPLTQYGGSLPGPYPITPSSPVELEATILNLDDKIIKENMPNGLIYEVFSDEISETSWKEAFAPGGKGSPGTHNLSLTTADSAIWTGTYLAALAYRYKVMRDEKSKRYVKKALKGIEAIFAINNNTGLLARFAAPLDTDVGRQIENPTGDYVNSKKFYAKIDNVDWIGHQGHNGISRDQYTGVMLGLRAAYDLVDDEPIRGRIRNLVTMILDYLIQNDWVITEDRDISKGGTPTPWALVPYQKITFLTIGKHVTGGYDLELKEAHGLLNMAWLSPAVSSLTPFSSYYSNNLYYSNLFSYLAIDQDIDRRENMMEGIRIADYYTGHHANAWFNLVRASYDKTNKKQLLEQALEILKLRLEGGHRHSVPPSAMPFLDNIQYEYIDLPLEESLVRIPTQPVHPSLRDFGEFVWQRSPYGVVNPTSFGNDGFSVNLKLEQIGGDISLVYWMLRSEGYADPLYWLPSVMSLLLN